MSVIIRDSILRPSYVTRLNPGVQSTKGCVFYVSYCDPAFQARDVITGTKATYLAGSTAGWGIVQDQYGIGQGTCYYNNGDATSNQNNITWANTSYWQQPTYAMTVAFRANIQAAPNGTFSIKYGGFVNVPFQFQNDATTNNFYFALATGTSTTFQSINPAPIDFGIWRTYVGRYIDGVQLSIAKFDDKGNILTYAANALQSGPINFAGAVLLLQSWQGMHDFFGIWNYCMTDAMVGQMIRERRAIISPTGRNPQPLLSAIAGRIPFALFGRTVI